MKKIAVVIGIFAALGALTVSPVKADENGWTLNLERSELAARVPIGEGQQGLSEKARLMLVTTGIAPRGHEGHLAMKNNELSYSADLRFNAKLDGRDYPLEGLSNGDSIAIAVQEDDKVISTIKASGHKVATFKRSLGNDARTMIISARYFDNNGRVSVSERLVFERR